MRPTSEVLEAVEAAIQLEKDGVAFYTEAASQIDDPRGKRMFQSLARDETAHLELFEDARAALLNGGGWPLPEQATAVSPEEFSPPSIFPTGDEIRTAEMPAGRFATLWQGIQAERDSIAFYVEQMERTEDPDGRAMYAYLVDQEECHHALLEGEYNYHVHCLETVYHGL